MSLQNSPKEPPSFLGKTLTVFCGRAYVGEVMSADAHTHAHTQGGIVRFLKPPKPIVVFLSDKQEQLTREKNTAE